MRWYASPREQSRPNGQQLLGDLVDLERDEAISLSAPSGSGEPDATSVDVPPPPAKIITCERRKSWDSPPETKVKSAPPAPRDPKLPRTSDPFSYERILEAFRQPAERHQPEDWVDHRCGRSTMTSVQRREVWNRSKAWILKFGPDSNGNFCEMKLYPMLMHSGYLLEKFEGVPLQGRKDRHLEIEVPECPCHAAALRLAESHCKGSLIDVDSLSNEILLKLVLVSKFLRMDCLTARASHFLLENLRSQEGCASFLKAFRLLDLTDDVEHRPFLGECLARLRQKMLDKYESDLEAMVYVASLLPREEAENFLQACRDNWCGLYHRTRLEYEEKDYKFILFSHATCNGSLNMRIRDSYTFKPCPWSSGQIADEIDSKLSSIADVEQRRQVVLSLAKALIGTRLKKSVDEVHLGTTRVSWDFLCILLKQAGDCLRPKTVFEVGYHEYNFMGPGCDEISHMHWMVASCVASTANAWLWIKYGVSENLAENGAVWGFQMLHFADLLGIVKQIAVLYPCSEVMGRVAFALDVTVGGKLNAGDFTVGEALAIYKSFPNSYRSSHLEIFRVFEAQLHGQVMSVREVAELANILDIDKVPYATLDVLAHALYMICHADETLLELCSLLDKEDRDLRPILDKIAKDLRLAHDLSVRFMSDDIQTELCSLLDWRGTPDDGFYKLFDKIIDNLKEERCSYVLFNTFWNRKIFDPVLRADAKEELIQLQLELGLRLKS